LGVFVPILGVSGFTGMVAKDLALTICIAISISYLSAIILIPVLSSLLLTPGEFRKESFIFRWIDRLRERYMYSLYWLAGRRKLVFVFMGIVLVGAFLFYRTLPGAFFPRSDSGEIDVNIQLPTGTKLVTTATVLRRFSRILQHIPEVKTVVTQIGRRGFNTQTNIGQVTLTLLPADRRKRSTSEIALHLRRMLNAPGVRVTISMGNHGPRGFSGTSGIRLSLIGPDIEVLQTYSDRIEQMLQQDPNVISVDNGRSSPTPELHFMVDRQRVSRMGTTLLNVAQTFKSETRGTLVGRYRTRGREVPIQVRGHFALDGTIRDLQSMTLARVDSQPVPLSAIGRFEAVKGYNQITRRDRQTVLDINIAVKGNQERYRRRITRLLQQQIVLPDGYRFDFTGSRRDFNSGVSDLLLALIFALALTYMIMAALFENLTDPFVIMFTIPLAFFGSLLLLYLTGTDLSIPADIGILILIGIVVNNGIVLVDYIHRYTREHQGERTYLSNLVRASSRRLRPILLTALTTTFSMVPLALALGNGSETWSPLARSVIGGLLFATLLTLFVIPILVIGISRKRRNQVDRDLQIESPDSMKNS